jgi:hypothetical protein
LGIGNTYSFKSLTGVLTNPVFGATISLTGGSIGAGSFTVRMTTTRTTHDVAADGTVMPSYVAGDNGEVDINVQESSALHTSLLALWNQCLLAANNDDVSGWAATSISFRMLTDQTQHTLTGCSFDKVPDKPYEASGKQITWKLMAANIVNQ